MTPSPSGRADFRSRVRSMLRATILDTARRLAIERDWAEVRIADIADEVGVSRQTIYNEYGAKEALGAALFAREIEEHCDVLVEGVRKAPDLPTAVRRTIETSLTTARKHPVVQRLLAPAGDGSGSPMLPLLTTRADMIVVPVRTRLAEIYQERFPGSSPERVELLTDLTVRATLSQVVLPSDLPEDEVVGAIVEMAVAAVRASATATE